MNRTQSPWWLEPGPEICPFCEWPVQFEALLFCATCDRPICPACQLEVQENRRVLCPECHAESGGT